ncbi:MULTISPECIES: molecular chaperone HtpG [unclassified Rhizobacter]|uniref:molecular chaperone HtpG n=1 Tax=unclassified Rhizobacter TaxID=2640088 RepID=UPI0006F8D7C8|nr:MULTISPECIES: molecular chaperone HtpG [unclassified Rhizobacter]KQU68421.1 heat-shock protein Hsp90 [Rhizobacter sp. Root29]KQW14491.1 heat-shock protein Hsp90 [Rhizobacter sp. Root1238]KRB16697.1 heat-shock protein Hsp90 [Rhizobacter sp. Root16D2]
MDKQTLSFQAEVKQILHLVTHSLYSNKEIFLRELVSNASDACDKLRFEALNNAALYEDAPNLEVRIAFDKAAKTLTITDNGIGLSTDEAVANLGTIAKSGTREFMSKLEGDQKKDAQLIGQFGVGFYSGFIVADRITVESRRAGLPAEQGVRWSSEGSGDFEVETITRAQRGTSVILHLRDGEEEFLTAWKLRSIIGKYSDHISLPILMQKEEWDADKQEQVVQEEWAPVNKAAALWTRSKSDITPEQYTEFYKQISYDTEAPLAFTHNRVEGRSEYTQLLYVPAKAPFDLWNRDKRGGVKLYVKRVFIMDDAEALMPVYLRFVKGVIDSADLPLNVSRELLQESRDVKAIREGSTKRVLGMLESLADSEDAAERAKYAAFWKDFGAVLKEGVGEDHANQERLTKLLRFASTHADEGVSFADYLGRMKEGQDAIYYITADNLAGAKSSPQLEIFRKKGIEVLLLVDRVDEWLLSHLYEVEGKPLQSVAKGSVDLGKLQDEAEKKQAEEVATAFQPVLDRLKEALKDRAKDVRATSRLVDSPACLVVEEGDISGHLARLLKQSGQSAPKTNPVLEVNVEHALVKRLETSAQFDELANILFDQAVLAEGGQLEDPAAYVRRVTALLTA